MIPILYEKGASEFTTNGLGRLTDAIVCSVTEEVNGIYEVEFEYPVSGKLFDYMIENGGVVYCTHDDAGDLQAFDIYAHTTPLDEIVTFRGRHISYRLNNYVVAPFTATSCASAVCNIRANASPTCPFSFWTDKNENSNFKLDHPESARSLLGGKAGSILDVYGKGEYKFDNFDVRLYVNRGNNTGVTIRYGKNLTDLEREYDASESYGSIAPYYQDDETTVYLPELYVSASGHENDPIMVMDMSEKFESAPTVAQLRTAAQKYLTDNTPWNPDNNLTINFVALWQTSEYEDVAIIQRLSLCDKASVYHPDLGIVSENVEVVKVVYNVLEDRYDSMELGSLKSSLGKTLLSGVDKTISNLETEIGRKPSIDYLAEAIDAATTLITGGLGGHVVINKNANGEPEEILIMDTDNINTAVNVWRFNLNGLGHSHSGYNGPFNDVALTMDGKINATMIAVGTLSANLIKAGIIQDEAGLNYWNMVTGELSLNAYSTTTQMNTAIETSAAGIRTSVSQTYETKSDATSKLNTAKSYADGAITSALTAYPTTTEMNSAISQSATEISASVTQKISALEIGGTNFLLNSAFDDATTPFADHGLSKWNNNGSAQMVTLESGITCALMQIRQKDVTDGTQSVWQNFTARVINDTAGQIYTVSGDFVVNNLDEGSNPSLVFIFNGYYDDNGTETLMTPTYLSSSTASLRDMPNNQWVRRTYTLKFPNKLSRTNFLVYGREVNCNIYWKNLKIEHGDKATAWSPAPEDRPTFAEMSSAITIAADGITSTVSQTYETKSDASSKQSSLQSQITQNANAITTKVSETDFTGAEIASRINQSAATVEIEADHINLNGIVTTNSGFSIDSNGYMTANGATINGTVTSKSDDTTETATLGAGQLDVRTTSQQTTVSRYGVSITDRDSGADSHTDITGGKIALSSLSPGSNYITLDPENGSSFDGAVTLNGSILTSLGDLSKTGTRLTFEPPGGAASIMPSGSSYLSIGNITLEKGCWVIWASAQFAANANGIRGMALSAAANTSTPVVQWTQDRASGMSGAATFCKCMHLVNLSAQTTYYVNVMQNSGSNLNAWARIVAMRIA